MSSVQPRAKVERCVGPVSPWPREIPVRVKPVGRDQLFVMTLGQVGTPLADGVFDPVADRVTLDDGTVIENYYKERLNVPFYQPIDKSVFPLPPSGWCSWYYYYQEINAEEVLINARWIAENLKEYGARYVQIDDGWQGTGHGGGENRDWTTIDVRFRERGMDGLAAAIRKLGLEAGLWLCPHGQSNEQVARESGAFLWKPDGTTASDTWEGTYLVDPSVPAGHGYLRHLFQRLRGWGYTYFKIDGQPIVLDEYAKKTEFMACPVEEDLSPVERAPRLYRDPLRTIRAAIGPDCYLLGCWGIPLPGVGILNGSRTAGDIVQGWDGFLVANDAVQQWNFLHNIGWYCDPDVCMVRPPLSEGAARAWATIQGLSGQALLTSGRLPDLPASRAELLRRIYPAVDIRPLDLFKPDHTRKPIWVLKVAHDLGTRRVYDVAGVFNYDPEKVQTYHLSWSALGLEADQQYHVYDFWQQIYLGAWENGIFVDVPPADVRVLTLVAAEDRPVLLGTSRHITQGWVDLAALSSSGTAAAPVLKGSSRVIGGDPYTLTIGLPRGEQSYRLKRVAGQGDRRKDVRTSFRSHQGYATATIQSDVTQTVSWEFTFEPTTSYVYPVQAPSSVAAEQRSLTEVMVTWPAGYSPEAGYQVLLNGQPVGITFRPRALLSGLRPGRDYVIGVRSVWYDGSRSQTAAEVKYTPPTLE